MLVGIVCSVSVVSAADINDTAVEIQSNNANMAVDGLSYDNINIQKMDDNQIGKVITPEELDNLNFANENVSKKNNVNYGDFGLLDYNYDSDHGLHFNLTTTFPTEDTHKLPNIDIDSIGKYLTTAIKVLGNQINQETQRLLDSIYPYHSPEKPEGRPSILNPEWW